MPAGQYKRKYGDTPAYSSPGSYRRLYSTPTKEEEEERERKRIAEIQKKEQERLAEESRLEAEKKATEPEKPKDTRGFWEKLGDAFEANSPEDKAKRLARGEPELYEDAQKKKKAARTQFTEARVSPEQITPELREYLKTQDPNFDVDKYVTHYDKYMPIHEGMAAFNKGKEGTLKDVDLKTMAEQAEKEGLFKDNEEALKDLETAKYYAKAGDPRARVFYGQAITKATPELTKQNELERHIGSLQTLIEQEQGHTGNILQKTARQFTTGVAGLIMTAGSDVQTLGSLMLETAVKVAGLSNTDVGKKLDKYAQERFDDAVRDSIATEEKLFFQGLRGLEGDGFAGQVVQGSGTLAAALLLGKAFPISTASATASNASKLTKLWASTKAFARPSVVGTLFGLGPAAETASGAKEAGLSSTEALLVGLPVGYVNSVLENWGVGTMLNRFGAGLSTAVIKNTITEGSQEFLQDMTTLFGHAVYEDVNWHEGIAQAWLSAEVGAVLGAGAGALTGVSFDAKKHREGLVDSLTNQGVSKEDAELAADKYDTILKEKAAEAAKKLDEADEKAKGEDKSVLDVKPPESGPSEIPGTNVKVTGPVSEEEDGVIEEPKVPEVEPEVKAPVKEEPETKPVEKSKTITKKAVGTLEAKPITIDKEKLSESEKSDNKYVKESFAEAKSMTDADALDVAKDAIRSYVNRGDTIQQLKSGQGGGSARGGFQTIGGYIDGKHVGTDNMVVKLDDGRIYKYKLQAVYDSIVAEGGVTLTKKGAVKPVVRKTKAPVESKTTPKKGSVKKLGKTDIEIKYPKKIDELPEKMKETAEGSKELYKGGKEDELTQRQADLVVSIDDGTASNKLRRTDIKTILKLNPGMKENPRGVIEIEDGVTYLAYKNERSEGRINLNAIGISNTRIKAMGLKEGTVVDLSAALTETGRVPVLRNTKTGAEGMVEPAFKQRKPLPARKVESAPLEEGTPDRAEAEKLTGLNEGIKMLSEALDVPVRMGRMRMKKALGEHHTREEIIRLRKVIGEGATEGGRFGVAAHEMGHNMAKNIPEFKLTKGKGIAALDAKGNKDLSSISTKPNKADLSGVYGEGFAEFIRYYVVNPEALVDKMPKTFKTIDDILEKHYPETKKALLRGRNIWREYQSASAGKRIMSQISYGGVERSLAKKITEGLPKTYAAMVNDLYYIEKLERMVAKEGVDIATTELPSVLATVHKGVYGKAKTMLEYGMVKNNPYVWNEENKKWEMNTVGKSFKEITQPIYNEGQEYAFDGYLVAKRAISIAEQKKMNVGVTYDDAVQAVKEWDQRYPHFAQVQKELVAFNEGVLDYIIEAGLITKEKAALFRKMNDNYVPLFKVIEAAGSQGFFGSGYADISEKIKRMKGSEEQIISPLESIVKNTFSLVQAADANRVGQALAEIASKSKYAAREFEKVKNPMAKVATVTLNDLGIEEAMKRVASFEGVSIVDEADINETIDIFRPMFQDKSEPIVSVRIDGKQHFYLVSDKSLYKSIMQMDEEQSSILLRMMGAPARLLRAGATLTPEFLGRNPIRDQFAAFVYSKTDYVMGYDLAKGVASAVKKDADYWMWQMSGGPYATLVSMDRDYAKNELQSITKGSMSQRMKHKQQRRQLFKERANPLRTLRDLSELMENATRLGEFREAIRNHKSLGRDQKAMHPIEAAMASKEITLDFSRAGWAGRKVNSLAAFFNANVQDIDKMRREMTKHPYRTSLKATISITIPSLLLYYMNRDEEWYKELPNWRKDLAWNFRIGNSTWSIPKPFLLGTVFGTIPERIAGALESEGEGDSQRDLSGIGDLIWDIIPNPLPTAVVIPIEVMTNYDMFTGRNIIPDSEADLDPSLQYGAYTSETAKFLSTVTGGFISPREVDHIISGYFAGLGRYGTAVTDKALDLAGRETIPKTAPEPWTDVPLIKGFVLREPYGSGSQSVNNFYRGLQKAETAEQTANFLEDKLNEPERAAKWREDHPEYALASSYRKIGQNMTDINRAIKVVQRSKDMTPVEKRDEIDKLNREMTYMAQQALRFDPMFSTEDLTPLPPTSNNDRINAAIGRGEAGEGVRIMLEHNEQLEAYLEDLGDFMTEEEKAKIRKDRRINLTESSIRTRYLNTLGD